MTRAELHSDTEQTGAPARGSRTVSLAAPLATTTAAAALLLGITADTLLRDGIGPVAFALWIAILTLTLVALVWHDDRRMPRESAAWLLAAVAFAGCITWRNSEILQFFDTIAVLGCLGLAVIRLRDPRAGIVAERARETLVAGVRAGLEIAFGFLPLVVRELSVPGAESRRGTRIRTLLRPVLLSTVIILVFGSLLRAADPIFASIATFPALDVGLIVSHVVTILFVAAIVAGWARSALLPTPTRVALPSGYGFTLGATDVATILGTLNVLFAAFVIAQLGWFFGGEAFLRARTGLTAAQYARGGFFQLLWVVALVVPVLVVTRGALRPGHALARRHTLLALPIVALLGVMIIGSMARLKLYVGFYGLTTDRFYPFVFMGWLFATLLWLAATVLRDWGRPFAAGSVVAAMVTLFSLNAFDPDVFVARVNVSRAESRGATVPLDVQYLAELSGGAVPYAVNALIAPRSGSPSVDLVEEKQRCAAAGMLLRRFGPLRGNRDGSADAEARWRFWNADDAVGKTAVAGNFRKLLAVRHTACAASREITNQQTSPTPAR